MSTSQHFDSGPGSTGWVQRQTRPPARVCTPMDEELWATTLGQRPEFRFAMPGRADAVAGIPVPGGALGEGQEMPAGALGVRGEHAGDRGVVGEQRGRGGELRLDQLELAPLVLL